MNKQATQNQSTKQFVYSLTPTPIRYGYRSLRHMLWLFRRNSIVEKYLANHQLRKLQIGTGFNGLEGWLNTDILPRKNEYVYMNAVGSFPLPDLAFDYVFCEHLIEHITYFQAKDMLTEIRRVMKPGGVVRLATPDLATFLAMYSRDTKTVQDQKFIDYVIHNYVPHATANSACFVVNNLFRNFGHKFIYDRETLEALLKSVGFHEFRWYSPLTSDDPNLQGIESHGKLIGDEEINQYETMVVEAKKS